MFDKIVSALGGDPPEFGKVERVAVVNRGVVSRRLMRVEWGEYSVLNLSTWIEEFGAEVLCPCGMGKVGVSPDSARGCICGRTYRLERYRGKPQIVCDESNVR